MVLNIKNLFKKVCMLSVAATMAVGLGASFVGAESPTTQKGVKVGSVGIDKAGSTVLKVTIPLEDTLTFNGNARQLILESNTEGKTLSVTSTLKQITFVGTDSDVDLYLRVSDDINTPPTKSDWIKYEEASTLMNAKLTRTDAGTYYVFYYVDGKTNYSDITGA